VAIAASLVEAPSGKTLDVDPGVSRRDPQAIMVWVSVPSDVVAGEPLTLTITVENRRRSTPFDLDSIDIERTYLRGFTLKSVEPAPTELDSDDECVSLEYTLELPPRSRQRFHVELVAETPGIFVGDVDVWGSVERENTALFALRAQTEIR
jgi:hypothetical protein